MAVFVTTVSNIALLVFFSKTDFSKFADC